MKRNLTIQFASRCLSTADECKTFFVSKASSPNFRMTYYYNVRVRAAENDKRRFDVKLGEITSRASRPAGTNVEYFTGNGAKYELKYEIVAPN